VNELERWPNNWGQIKRDSMSIEEATIPNMWEIAAIEEWAQGYPPGLGTSFGVFHPTPVPLPLRVETGNLKLKNLIPLLGGRIFRGHLV
jgi:hypothetical protein